MSSSSIDSDDEETAWPPLRLASLSKSSRELYGRSVAPARKSSIP